MPTSERRPYGGPWKTIRLRILTRDGYACQIRGPKCTVTATEVDHIIPTTIGGSWYDETNLRASCSNCNKGRAGKPGRELWRNGRTTIVLVIGTDASRYVNQHADPGDLIIDDAALIAATGSPQAALQARTALLDRLRRAVTKERHAWITSNDSHDVLSLPHHRVLRLDQGGGGGGAESVAVSSAPTTPADGASRSW